MTVALVRSEGHYEGVSKALKLIEDQVITPLRNAKSILIKPNFVSVRVELSATPVDAVRAVLDFIRGVVGDREILIAEGPAAGSCAEGLRNYGYLSLREEYNVEFMDLNEDPEYEVIEVYDRELKRTVKVRISRTVMESDFRISICRPKTHDTVITTLTIKNMVVGAILDGDKPKIHQGYLPINLTLALLATMLMPHLAIIDGYVAMEGDGPVHGDPKPWGIAAAGMNPLEVDALVAWLMGFNPYDVGYLYYLHELGYGELELSKIRVLGEDPQGLRVKFRPHRSISEQMSWKLGRTKGLATLIADLGGGSSP